MENLIKPPRAYKHMIHVPVGDGAAHTIPNLWSRDDENALVRKLHMENGDDASRIAGSIIDSFDYLLDDEITHKEACRRLRLLRAARKSQRGYVA